MDASSMYILPWLSLVAIIWLQSTNGTSSDFSAYSSQLKSRLGISQVQLNYLTVASDSGKLFGWCSGVAAIYLPLPFVVLIGAAIGLVGYGVPYLFLVGRIAALSYAQAVVLSVLAGNSICWINTACYVASMRKFPADHGIVVALSTSYSALSAKIYIAIARLILGKNPTGGSDSIYLLLNSVTPMGVGLVMAPLLMNTKLAGTGTRSGLVLLFVIAGTTGAYSIYVSVAFHTMSTRVPQVVLLLLVASIVGVPLVNIVRWLWDRSCQQVREVEEVVVSREEEAAAALAPALGGGNKEYGVWRLVGSVDFWLYFWVYLCGATLGLVFMNNLGQISQSRGVGGSKLLSISSSFGFFGKLASAPISAFAGSRYMVSRPASMGLLMAPMAGSFFLLLNPTMPALYASTAVIGMCSGAMASIAVSMTAELFGSRNFSVNHNILIANIPIGSFAFGYMAGYIYDRNAGEEDDHGTCGGVQCYHKTFVYWGLICSMGTLLSIVLYLRTRKGVWQPSSHA